MHTSLISKRPYPIDRSDEDLTDIKQHRGSSPPLVDMSLTKRSNLEISPSTLHSGDLLLRPICTKEAVPSSDIRLKKEHLLAAAARSLPDALMSKTGQPAFSSLKFLLAYGRKLAVKYSNLSLNLNLDLFFPELHNE
jgi:hypothetical protein